MDSFDKEKDKSDDSEEHDFPDDEIKSENIKKTRQDEIIENEEREIQRIIEEGEKAAKETEAQRTAVPESGNNPPAVSGDGKPEENKGLWKWFLAGIGIVLIVGLVFVGFKYMNSLKFSDLQHSGPLVEYSPAEFLSGWKIKSEYLTLADMPMEKKQEFFEIENLNDIATWEFKKGDDTIFVWTRQFADEAAAQKDANSAFGMFAWRAEVNPTALSFGNEGKVGVYRITGHDPLLAFVRQNNTVMSVAYYNTNNEEYNAAKLSDDRIFLIGLAKKIMTKIAAANGEELAIASINP